MRRRSSGRLTPRSTHHEPTQEGLRTLNRHVNHLEQCSLDLRMNSTPLNNILNSVKNTLHPECESNGLHTQAPPSPCTRIIAKSLGTREGGGSPSSASSACTDNIPLRLDPDDPTPCTSASCASMPMACLLQLGIPVIRCRTGPLWSCTPKKTRNSC